jgi:hypothetical protein
MDNTPINNTPVNNTPVNIEQNNLNKTSLRHILELLILIVSDRRFFCW